MVENKIFSNSTLDILSLKYKYLRFRENFFKNFFKNSYQIRIRENISIFY